MRHHRLPLVAVVLFSVLLALGGCAVPGTYTVRQFEPNPTAWEFHAGLADTQAALRQAFPPGFRFDGSEPSGKSTSIMGDRGFTPIDPAHRWATSFGQAIFIKPENRDDVYLFAFTPRVGKSLVYQRGGAGLDYYATFHLHVTAVDAGRTRVEVLTLNPRIPCGRVFNVHAGSGYVDSMAKVKPTTIEEYQLLLRLGAALREPAMPPLRVPGATAPTTTRVGP